MVPKYESLNCKHASIAFSTLGKDIRACPSSFPDSVVTGIHSVAPSPEKSDWTEDGWKLAGRPETLTRNDDDKIDELRLNILTGKIEFTKSVAPTFCVSDSVPSYI